MALTMVQIVSASQESHTKDTTMTPDLHTDTEDYAAIEAALWEEWGSLPPNDDDLALWPDDDDGEELPDTLPFDATAHLYRTGGRR